MICTCKDRRFAHCRSLEFVMKIEICAGTVTLNSLNQLLLVRPSNRNAWAIPKGHVEPGESWTEAAQRETFEETRVRVTIIEQLQDFSVHTSASHKTVKTFLARADDDAAPNPDGFENAEASYFDLSDLPKIIPSQREWLMNTIAIIQATRQKFD